MCAAFVPLWQGDPPVAQSTSVTPIAALPFRDHPELHPDNPPSKLPLGTRFAAAIVAASVPNNTAQRIVPVSTLKRFRRTR